MDFGFNEEQEAIREAARGIFQGMVNPDRVAEVEATDERIDRDLWKALADADLLGVGIAEAHGGIGGGMVELGLVLEEQGQVVAQIPLMATLVLGAWPLSRSENKDLANAWLAKVVAGDAILTGAFSDAATSPTLSPAVHARRGDGGWILDGTASAVASAHVAHAIVVPAKLDDGGIVLVLVEPGMKGLTIESAVATNRAIYPNLHFDAAVVPETNLVAGPESGRSVLDETLLRAMTALSLIQIGVCEAALTQTAAHLNERIQFGRPLSTFQGTMLRAADAAIDVEAIRVTAWQAAWRLDQGFPAFEAVLVAKWQAADRGQRVVHATQHLHGGTGADITYPIHRYFLWGKQIELELGSPGLQLSRLGTLIADHPDLVVHR